MTSHQITAEMLDNDLRAMIFTLLLMYKRLNVTQISRLLGKHKATISRHLKRLELAKLLASEEENDDGKISEGRIPPKFYSLDRNSIEQFIPLYSQDADSIEENPIAVLESIRMYIFLFTRALAMLVPLAASLDSRVTSRDGKTYTVIRPVELAAGKINFHTLNFSEERLGEFIKLYEEFRKKANECTVDSSNAKGDEIDDARNTMLFINAILPVKDILKKQIELNQKDD